MAEGLLRQFSFAKRIFEAAIRGGCLFPANANIAHDIYHVLILGFRLYLSDTLI